METPEEINRALKLPVIGFIPEIDKEVDKASIVLDQPKSLVAESFRALKVSLDLSQTSTTFKSLLIGSVSKTEGKSMISSNLALTLATGGKKVLLLDADLRRPSLHNYLKLENEKGLSTLLLSKGTIQECMQQTPVENLTVITAGEPVVNPSDLIGSDKMKVILVELSELADILIVDGPPILVSDSTLLSTEVDEVLIVVGYGLTRKSEAIVALKQLQSVGAKIAGVVLNRIPRSNRNYFRLYHYDYGMPDETKRIFRLGKLTIPLGHKRAEGENKVQEEAGLRRTSKSGYR